MTGVLLVEADPAVALAEAGLLSSLDYTVVTAADPATAIDLALHQADINLVLIDTHLGQGQDGIQAAQMILEQRQLPLIFLTNASDPHTTSRVQSIPHYGYVLKDPPGFVLKNAIEMALRLFDAQQKARQNEERFHNLFLNHGTMMMLIDPFDGSIIDANRASEKFYGYPLASLRKMNIADISTLPASEVASIRQLVFQEQYNHFIAPHRLADGSIRSMEVHSYPIPGYDGPILFAIYHDVSDRLRAEQALETSEARFRAIFEQSPIAIGTYDRAGRLSGANQAFLDLFGVVDVGDIMGFDLLNDPNLADEHRQQLAAGQGVHYQVAFDFEKGKRLGLYHTLHSGISWLDISIQPLAQAAAAGPGGYLAQIQDISQRKADEDKLQAALDEKETLLKEVHHRVKNNLATIVSLLALQADTIQDPAARQAMLDSRQRVFTMAMAHEELYRSEDLRRIEAGAYLQRMAGRIAESYNFNPYVDLAVQVEEVWLPLEKAVPLGQLANELLTNAFKYAFPNGRAGSLQVVLTLEQENLHLRVADNGVGLPEGLELSTASTLGMQIVWLLTAQLRGDIQIRRGHGTEFLISIPLEEPATPTDRS